MDDDEELETYIVNDRWLYDNYRWPAILALAAKMQDGTYTHKAGVEAFLKVAYEGAKRYGKDVEPRYFSTTVKRAVAESMADFFETEYKINQFGIKPARPSTAKPSPRGATAAPTRKTNAQLDREIAESLAARRKGK